MCAYAYIYTYIYNNSIAYEGNNELIQRYCCSISLT